jgi:hypothetical protein
MILAQMHRSNAEFHAPSRKVSFDNETWKDEDVSRTTKTLTHPSTAILSLGRSGIMSDMVVRVKQELFK